MRAYFSGIGGGRFFGMLGAFALASLVTGCGWFDSTPTVKVVQSRPGAERSVPAGGLQATGAGRQYDGDIRPVDESRPIGSVIADKGGQKAQLDAVAKDAAERDSAAREAEAKRKAEAPVPPPITPASVPAVEAAPTQLGGPATTAPLPLPGTSAPVPPPAPVTSAPVPPPAPGPQTSIPAPTPAPASPATTQ